MAMKLSFHPQRENSPPEIIVSKPAKPPIKLSNLNMFKQLEKTPPASEGELTRRKKVEGILQELDSLVGLDSVKKLVLEIQAFV